MAKFWLAGSTKTRLGREIGMARAAEIHREFFGFLTRRLGELSNTRSASSSAAHSMPDGFSSSHGSILSRTGAIRLEVVFSPADREAEFRGALEPQAADWNFQAQTGGDLGNRMRSWFHHALRTSQVGILIGCDCPLISAADITQCLEKLREVDVVLGPAVDGGYYLIGIAGPSRPQHEALFSEIPWSTEAVLATTLARVAASGMSAALMEPRRDVDELPDLRVLLDHLAHSENDQELELAARVNTILSSPPSSPEFTDRS